MVELEHSFRERIVAHQVHHYMYGTTLTAPGKRPGEEGSEAAGSAADANALVRLAPMSTSVGFDELTIYRIGGGKPD